MLHTHTKIHWDSHFFRLSRAVFIEKKNLHNFTIFFNFLLELAFTTTKVRLKANNNPRNTTKWPRLAGNCRASERQREKKLCWATEANGGKLLKELASVVVEKHERKNSSASQNA